MISDKIWEALQPAVEAAKHSKAGAPGKMIDRDFLEALLYLNRAGFPWRDLPSALGLWIAVYIRFRRWEARGIWQRLWKNLQAENFAQARDLFMDSSTVRTHHHAAGAPKKTASTRLWAALGEDSAPRFMPPPSLKTARLHST
ncbi:MAG: transposase [Chthoniobacteraceae bacterium]